MFYRRNTFPKNSKKSQICRQLWLDIWSIIVEALFDVPGIRVVSVNNKYSLFRFKFAGKFVIFSNFPETYFGDFWSKIMTSGPLHMPKRAAARPEASRRDDRTSLYGFYAGLGENSFRKKKL